MDTLQFIVQRFDITRLKTCCNVRKCKKPPTKELLLLEFDQNRPARRIASLYLCNRHCMQEAESISREFKKSGGKHIGGRIYNMPPITH